MCLFDVYTHIILPNAEPGSHFGLICHIAQSDYAIYVNNVN